MKVITDRELKQINLLRISMVVGAVLYLSFWYISVYLNHNKWDPFYLRLIVSLVMLSTTGLSYVSHFFKRNIEYTSFVAIVIGLAHYCLVMAGNDVSASIGSGLYIYITVSAFCLQRLALMLIYDFFGVIFIYLIFANVANPTLKPTQILFGFIYIMIANHITMLIRKRLEKNLENEVDNFQNLFNSTFEGLALVEDQKVIQTNLPFDLIFGVPILNRPLKDIVNLQPGYDFTTEGFKGFQKSKILLKIKRKPLLMNNKEIDLYSVTDITQEVEQQAKLANTNKLASLGEMSSGIAHEINNPLAIIQSSTELLKEFVEQPSFEKAEVVKQINLIQKTVERVSRIIIGLRIFSRDASADHFKPVSAARLVEEVFSFCETALKSKGIRIEKNVKDVPLFCRQVQIEQVLLNLITNATYELDHVSKEQRLLRISVYTRDTNIVIEVEDSGRGVPETLQEKLFQPFFTTKPIGTGTGLGLSISKGIIDSHHGEIFHDAKSELTKFVVILPQPQKLSAPI